jgi:Baseplate J-like protein
MSFQVRNHSAIVARMIARVVASNPRITDFTEGGVVRSLLDALADEIQETDQNTYDGIRDAILTGTYRSFEFAKLPASYALGTELFTAVGTLSSPVLIPAGTRVAIPGASLVYETTADAVLPVSPGFVSVPIRCEVVETVGNTGANTITSLLDILGNAVVTVTNPTPLITGSDQEDDSARFTRFQNYIAGLSKGTAFAFKAVAEAVFLPDENGFMLEGVRNALVVEPWTDGAGFIGVVNVYIDNGTATASSELVAAVLQALLGYTDDSGVVHSGVRAAGVRTTVSPVIPAALDLTATITLLPGESASVVIPNVVNAIVAYLQTLQAGEAWIVAQTGAAAINAGGIRDIDITSATLEGSPISPVRNATPLFNRRITAGLIQVTAA